MIMILLRRRTRHRQSLPSGERNIHMINIHTIYKLGNINDTNDSSTTIW